MAAKYCKAIPPLVNPSKLIATGAATTVTVPSANAVAASHFSVF